jgi:hypothetical protein
LHKSIYYVYDIILKSHELEYWFEK